MPTTTFVKDSALKQTRASHERPGADVLGRKPGYVVPAEERQEIVTDWSGMDDFHHAPPDYGIFFEQYKSYTVWYLNKFGFVVDDMENVVMDLMTRFMERDSMGVFSNGWSSRSKTGESVFRTYYTHFLLAYAPGKKRNLVRVKQNELLLWDAAIGDEDSTTWGDLNGPTDTIDAEVDFDSMVAGIRSEATDLEVSVVERMIELALGSTKKLRRADVVRELGMKPKDAEEVLEKFTQTVEAVAVHGRRSALRSPAVTGDLTLSELAAGGRAVCRAGGA